MAFTRTTRGSRRIRQPGPPTLAIPTQTSKLRFPKPHLLRLRKTKCPTASGVREQRADQPSAGSNRRDRVRLGERWRDGCGMCAAFPHQAAALPAALSSVEGRPGTDSAAVMPGFRRILGMSRRRPCEGGSRKPGLTAAVPWSPEATFPLRCPLSSGDSPVVRAGVDPEQVSLRTRRRGHVSGGSGASSAAGEGSQPRAPEGTEGSVMRP